jgi:CHAT domain-containing protein/tetratricopeptide (TPR) repeat protein
MRKLLISAFVALSVLAYAQETEPFDFYFGISAVKSRNGKTIEVEVPYGSNIGLKEGDVCSVWGLYYSEYPTHNKATLANGKILKVYETKAIARLEEEFNDPERQVYAQDMLAITLQVPKPAYRSVFYHMASLTIYFTDVNGEPIYTFDDMFFYDSPELEAEILKSMVEAISYTGEAMKELMDDIPVTSGLYKDKMMLDAMMAVEARDVMSFIRFVKEYPGKYMGNSWKISETYATWMINNTVFSSVDMAELLKAIKSDAEIKPFVVRYREVLTSDLVIETGEHAIGLAGNNKLDEARLVMERLVKVCEQLGDPDKLGFALFQYAKTLDEADQLKDIPPYYERAQAEFKKSNNAAAQSKCINNLAGVYRRLENHQKSIEMYLEAIRMKEAVLAKNPNDLNSYSDLAMSNNGLALAYGKLKEYKKAQEQYQKASDNYAKAGNDKKADDMLENLADNYGEAGMMDDCIRTHLVRMKKHESNGNQVGIGDVLFDIGFAYNKYAKDYNKSIEYFRKSYDLHMQLKDYSMAALSMSNIGQSNWSLKKLDDAIVAHLEAIKTAEMSGNKKRIAHSWEKLAEIYKENGDPKNSLDAYDRIIEIYEEIQDSRLQNTLADVGDVFKENKDYIKAVRYYQRCSELSRKNGDFEKSSDALFSIADIYYTEKKFDLSKQYYEESMQDAAKADYASQEIYCLSNIGLIYSIKNKFQESDKIFTEALAKAQKLGDKNIIGYCKYRLAGTAERQRDYKRAEQLYNEALTLYKELDSKKWQVNVMIASAWIYSSRGLFEQAMKVLDQAEVIAIDENDKSNIASILSTKSDIYLRILGEFDKSWEMEERAMSMYREVDNPWGIAGSYLSFGNIKNLSGEYAKAIHYYDKADSMFAQLENLYSQATASNNKGSIYYWQGDYEKSLAQFEKAISILDALGIKDASRTMYMANKGEVYMEMKRYAEAETILTQAIKESREIEDVNLLTSNLLYLGKLKTETGHYVEAEKYILESQQIEQKYGLKAHLHSGWFALGKLAYLKKDKRASQYLDESIRIMKEMGVDKELWEAYFYKGLQARDEGKLEESKEHLINAIETLEKIQGKMVGGEAAKKLFSSGERQTKVYGTLVDVLIMKGEVELAMQYLERANIEALRNKFKDLSITFTDQQANEKLEQERELKRKLDNLERAIAEEKSGQSSQEKLVKLQSSKTIAENEYLKFVNTTINSNPELSKHFSGGFHPRKLKTDKNRQMIPKELIVLSYLPANDKLYIFAATSDTVVAKVVDVTTDELNKKIKYLYNFASHVVAGHETDALRVARGDNSSPVPGKFNTNESKYKTAAAELYSWTIAPVRDQLVGKDQVVVIPTGMLHFLPFQMLGEKLPNGKFEYLIEHYTLFYAHSLEMLYAEARKVDEISILAMANADKSLPAAEKEVKDLKALYPSTEVYIHEKASEDKAKTHSGKHNILHFATHGNLDYFDYHKSYLTLAPDPDGIEDGKLTIEEVWEISDINSYLLVTLSACKTAVAEDLNSGWAVSPATSFLDAGAPTVVASLWAVNDESTSILMKYFYRNLKTMSKVEALRRAQIELSQNPKFSHPYYWAPFILIGDWR